MHLFPTLLSVRLASMPIANSMILIYRKVLFGKLVRLSVLRLIGLCSIRGLRDETCVFALCAVCPENRGCSDGKRSQCRTMSGRVQIRCGYGKEVRLSGLPFLPVLQRFPLSLLPKRKDRDNLFQIKHHRTDSPV
jgi:hypothetical protein